MCIRDSLDIRGHAVDLLGDELTPGDPGSRLLLLDEDDDGQLPRGFAVADLLGDVDTDHALARE